MFLSRVKRGEIDRGSRRWLKGKGPAGMPAVRGLVALRLVQSRKIGPIIVGGAFCTYYRCDYDLFVDCIHY